jgi:hypothetical protein
MEVIRTLLQNRTSIPAACQRLRYGGRVLQGVDATLSSLGVLTDATLEFTMRALVGEGAVAMDLDQLAVLLRDGSR